MRRIARRRERLKKPSNLVVNLTPLIDVALTLLVIFMITAPMLQNGIKVELPQGEAKEIVSEQQEFVVTIDKDEKIYFNGELSQSEDDLIKAIQTKLTTNPDRTVFVQGQTDIHYGKVIELVDRIKCVGGIRYVALGTQKRS